MVWNLIFIIVLCLPLCAHAEWLCREASSSADDNIFYSCGVSTSKNLYDARKDSLIHAKEEFKAFCDESSHCKNNEYIITPMRTDCNQSDDTYTCYRGLKYRILDKKRDYSNISISELKEDIEKKEQLLQTLNQKLDGLNQIKELDSKIEKFEDIDNLELNIGKLQSKLNYWPKGKAGIQLFYLQIPFSYSNDALFGIGPEYERLIFKDIIGIKLNVSYLMGLSTKDDLPERGTANTSSNPDYHSHKGIDANISLPIHIKYITLAPKFGHTSVSYKSTTKSYNNFGVALNELSIRQKFDDNYVGLNLRYNNKFFFDIEPRKYTKSNKTIIKIGLGINIDF